MELILDKYHDIDRTLNLNPNDIGVKYFLIVLRGSGGGNLGNFLKRFVITKALLNRDICLFIIIRTLFAKFCVAWLISPPPHPHYYKG